MCANLILVNNTRDLAIPVSADAVVVNGTAFGKEHYYYHHNYYYYYHYYYYYYYFQSTDIIFVVLISFSSFY